MGADLIIDEMMSQLGDFGRYQAFQFCLHILSALTAGLHMLSLQTVAAVPEHRCYIEALDGNHNMVGTIATGAGIFQTANLTDYIPKKADGQSFESCLMYTNSYKNETMGCGGLYLYDNTYYKSSRTMDWNFVCDRLWMGSIAQTTYMLGVFTGAVVLGGLADKYGRKTIFCWSALLQLILGVGVAFIPAYIPFLIVRFVYGIFGSAGSYITGFVLTMELVGASKRTVCGITFQGAFAGGVMLVAAWGALIPDRQLLQIVYGLHGCLLIVHWWVMDESPRWLWMQGRTDEAVAIVAKGVRLNKRGIELDKSYYLTKSKIVQQSQGGSSLIKNGNGSGGGGNESAAGIADLFKTPNLRMKTLNACFCWFANSLVYYGLSLSAGKLYGNPFLILFIMGLVEFPSYITIIFLLDRLGRRSITSTLMLLGGLCCIIAAFIERGSMVSTGIVMLGKLFIAGSFAVIYNYSAELFPTVVRNSAMGLGSMCARLSGALTPLITLLDSLNPTIPAVIFGVIALVSGLWVTMLPETMNQPMPQSLAEGELFGKGDTCFGSCFGDKKKNRKRMNNDNDDNIENMVPLEPIER